MKKGSSNAPGNGNESALTLKDSNQAGFSKLRQVDRAAMTNSRQSMRGRSDRRELRQYQPGMQKRDWKVAILRVVSLFNIISVIGR
jgi:hypothetical protein